MLYRLTLSASDIQVKLVYWLNIITYVKSVLHRGLIPLRERGTLWSLYLKQCDEDYLMKTTIGLTLWRQCSFILLTSCLMILHSLCTVLDFILLHNVCECGCLSYLWNRWNWRLTNLVHQLTTVVFQVMQQNGGKHACYKMTKSI